jgi:hypothetical protein
MDCDRERGGVCYFPFFNLVFWNKISIHKSFKKGLKLENQYFPKWKDADKVMNGFINAHFGIYLSRPYRGMGYITFLPEDKFATIIKSEHANMINTRALAFTRYIEPIMKKRGTLNNVSDNLSLLAQEKIIKRRFLKFFRFYNKHHHKSVIRELKVYLGITSLDLEGTRAKIHLNFIN